MNNSPSNLCVAVCDHTAVIKVSGRANFTTSITFKRLVTELRQRGINGLTLDLSECVTMDSTFLGVLAGTALMPTEPTPGPSSRSPAGTATAPGGLVCLLNPNQRVADLLDNLGICHLFQIENSSDSDPSAQRLTPASDVAASREELSRNCLEAHELLMRLNPANVPRFKDVAHFLAEDLKKMSVPSEGKSENSGSEK